ncbi:MAG TPA: hypothetical protein DHV62_04420 [Elusimicrobia bacterium]|jgi:putative FmdB family regulatory protein|nr:hypothetical protein [Elusimicrobiota bacterium]
MPIYEYFCENCQKKYEILVFSRGMNQNGSYRGEKVVCPVCGNTNLTRLFSRFAFSRGIKNTGNESSSGVSSCATCSGGDCSTCAR